MKLHRRDTPDGGIIFLFRCPGCGCAHPVQTAGAPPLWEFNGNLEAPTFSPSILVKEFTSEGELYNICHLFVRDGQLEFLPDCMHGLAGQTVPLPDWHVPYPG